MVAGAESPACGYFRLSQAFDCPAEQLFSAIAAMSFAYQPTHSPQSKRAALLHHICPTRLGFVFLSVAEYFFSHPRSLIVVLSFQLSAYRCWIRSTYLILRPGRPAAVYFRAVTVVVCQTSAPEVLRHWRSAVFPCGHFLQRRYNSPEQTHLNTE